MICSTETKAKKNDTNMKLIFSKIAGNPFPPPADVVAAIGSMILPKRLSFPGGEHFMSREKMTKLAPPSPTPYKNSSIDQRPCIQVRVKSGYFEHDNYSSKDLFLSGIKCELVFVEVQTSITSTKIHFGDKVGHEEITCTVAIDDEDGENSTAGGRISPKLSIYSGNNSSRPSSPTQQHHVMTKTIKREIPVLKEKSQYQLGKGMPRTSDQIEKAMKQTLNPVIKAQMQSRKAKNITMLTRDLPGYEHVRTWGKKQVQEFLTAYGISVDGLLIFDEVGIRTGADLLTISMKTLEKISNLGGSGHNQGKR